jgi:tetratricopeptide (TPR) repeat protein
VAHLDGARFPAADYELETFYAAYAYGWSPLRALVSGPLKYIEAPRKELYELPTDPRETHDLAKVPARAGRLREMDAELKRHVGSDAPSPALDDETEERRNRLASLGYVGGSQPPSSVAAIDPKDGIVWLRELDTARRTAEAGDGAAAAAAIEKLLAKNPDNLQALFALVGVRAAGKQWPQAVATARRAVALQAQSALARLHLANSLAGESEQRTGARAEALKTFDEAIALVTPASSRRTWTRPSSSSGRRTPRPRAPCSSGRAPRGSPTRPWRRRWEGSSTRAGTRRPRRPPTSARSCLDPGEPKALEGLGKLAFEGGDLPKAISYYERALEASPQARLAKTLGSLRLEVDDVEGGQGGVPPGARARTERSRREGAPRDDRRDRSVTPFLLAAASVLVVTLDTTRADHLGCYGAAQASTPAIDALASAGARFDQALSAAPLTFPSHATIFTGRLPRHHGVRDNALFRLKKDVPVLAESFRKAGYRTGAFVSAAVSRRKSWSRPRLRRLRRHPGPRRPRRGAGEERRQDRRRGDRVPDEGEAAVLRLGAPLRPARAVHAPRTVRDEARRASLRRRDRLHGRAGGPARGGGARARRVGADHPGRGPRGIPR